MASTRPALSRDRTSTVPITTQQIHTHDFPLNCALVQGRFGVTGNVAPSINQCLGLLLEGAVGLVAVSGAVDETGGKAW